MRHALCASSRVARLEIFAWSGERPTRLAARQKGGTPRHPPHMRGGSGLDRAARGVCDQNPNRFTKKFCKKFGEPSEIPLRPPLVPIEKTGHGSGLTSRGSSGRESGEPDGRASIIECLKICRLTSALPRKRRPA